MEENGTEVSKRTLLPETQYSTFNIDILFLGVKIFVFIESNIIYTFEKITYLTF